jgi:hypothetical protein
MAKARIATVRDFGGVDEARRSAVIGVEKEEVPTHLKSSLLSGCVSSESAASSASRLSSHHRRRLTCIRYPPVAPVLSSMDCCVSPREFRLPLCRNSHDIPPQMATTALPSLTALRHHHLPLFHQDILGVDE